MKYRELLLLEEATAGMGPSDAAALERRGGQWTDLATDLKDIREQVRADATEGILNARGAQALGGVQAVGGVADSLLGVTKVIAEGTPVGAIASQYGITKDVLKFARELSADQIGNASVTTAQVVTKIVAGPAVKDAVTPVLHALKMVTEASEGNYDASFASASKLVAAFDGSKPLKAAVEIANGKETIVQGVGRFYEAADLARGIRQQGALVEAQIDESIQKANMRAAASFMLSNTVANNQSGDLTARRRAMEATFPSLAASVSDVEREWIAERSRALREQLQREVELSRPASGPPNPSSPQRSTRGAIDPSPYSLRPSGTAPGTSPTR